MSLGIRRGGATGLPSRHRPLARLCLTLAIACAAASVGVAPAAAVPSSVPSRFPVTDGIVNAIAVDGRTAYIGGEFSNVGAPTGPLALLSPDTGDVVRSFPSFGSGPHSTVAGSPKHAVLFAIEPDGAGGWFVGGEFGYVGGVERWSLAHLRADGTVDPRFRADVLGRVTALALAGDTLWIGGRTLQRINGQAVSNLAAVDAVTGAPRPYPAGPTGDVTDIDLEGGRLYVVGTMYTIGGQDRLMGGALDAATGEVLDWDPHFHEFGEVTDVEAHGGVVYFAGSFSYVGGSDAEYAAAVSAADGKALPIDFGIVSPTSVVAVNDDTVVYGGHFDKVQGEARPAWRRSTPRPAGCARSSRTWTPSSPDWASPGTRSTSTRSGRPAARAGGASPPSICARELSSRGIPAAPGGSSPRSWPPAGSSPWRAACGWSGASRAATSPRSTWSPVRSCRSGSTSTARSSSTGTRACARSRRSATRSTWAGSSSTWGIRSCPSSPRSTRRPAPRAPRSHARTTTSTRCR